MAWKIEFDAGALDDLDQLDNKIRERVFKFLRNRIETDADPRRFGGPLRHDKRGLWKYRVEDFRIICKIEDKKVLVLVVHVGHRREVYKSK